MSFINNLLDWCRAIVRTAMGKVAVVLNRLSRGRLTANHVTIIGLLAHIPIAWLIGMGVFPLAALLLVVFGLFDTLDGALARLQKSESSAGMLLDASTDRFKEVLIYTGAAYFFVMNAQATAAVWAVAACGASLCVSYVKAKGEAAVRSSKLSASEVNRLFQDGLMRFEIRMFLVVVGLLSNQLAVVIILIALLSALTALQRLLNISRQLAK